ncbi:hypothetical protein J2X66_003465 [Pseudomonas sp. 3296]|uniref:ABC-three component system protein n=1 Tax=Pseudomonas sp. 3296 TaxID=2817753 RepID=UPI0028584A3A|nr:ABC-three component system protein [Pseudomonas sp. 3296]MDR6916591.1 hypothetical protein [Pseudomonas sp. 3296]
MNPAQLKKIETISVVVSNGSGVLVQPLTEQYSYVFTAKHNVLTNPDDLSSSVVNAKDVEVRDKLGRLIAVKEILCSSVKDAAVLVVDYTEIPIIYTGIGLPAHEQKLVLYGYPGTRREGNSIEARVYFASAQLVKEDYFTVSTLSFSQQNEIIGVSGGGLFDCSREEIFLVGIEYQMEGKPEVEAHGWLDCIPATIFLEIVASNTYNSVPLLPVLPSHLLCFSRVISDCFPLEGCTFPEDMVFLRGFLRQLGVDRIMSKISSPVVIQKLFGEKLLVDGTPVEHLSDLKLWSSWIELLIVSQILDPSCSVDDNYLGVLRNKRRFLFTPSHQDWLRSLHDIYKSDLSGLARGGCIVISSNRQPVKSPTTEQLKRVVLDVSKAPNTVFKIDQGIGNPAEAFNLYHLDLLHADCIIQNETELSEFGSLDTDIIISRLAEIYGKFLS